MLEILSLPFFQRALIAGLLLGLLMAVLGVFVVLRRMAFFSDAIGHSALAGIAIGLFLGYNPFLGALAFAVLVALGIAGIRRISSLSTDTLLGVFFAASVALGVIIVYLTPGYQTDLLSFLFGDILTVTSLDIALSSALTVFVFTVMIVYGKKFIAITFDPALAKAEGVPTARYELLFLIILAAVIALAIKLVGIVLVTAMLIIPAAAAQNISRSLFAMFAWSVIISLSSVVIGMLLSAFWRLPSGPAVILTGTVFFTGTLIVKLIYDK